MRYIWNKKKNCYKCLKFWHKFYFLSNQNEWKCNRYALTLGPGFMLCTHTSVYDTHFWMTLDERRTRMQNTREICSFASERLGGYNLFGEENKRKNTHCMRILATKKNSHSTVAIFTIKLTFSTSFSLFISITPLTRCLCVFFVHLVFARALTSRAFCVLYIAFARTLTHFIHASFYFHSV